MKNSEKENKSSKNNKVLIKVHEAYREIVAVCDTDIIGMKFEEGNLQLETNEHFYGGDEITEIKAIELLKEKAQEDACFNFAGKNAVAIGIKAGIISKKGTIKIQGVPSAMALL